ncbi:hypothetical protein AGOR_G00141870 [Albula goreensis]|uniref:Uncharacterized protein n=1 Tax=Albula goreensis TaxID=1534307 RepID=A0A8T3D0T6_9TELE|nr:hypothetical protein AGOR_G00141870 [Albula goreensis]
MGSQEFSYLLFHCPLSLASLLLVILDNVDPKGKRQVKDLVSYYGFVMVAPLSRLDHGKTSIAAKESGGAATPPEIPQREIQGRGRGAVSPCSSTPQRRAESPATPTRGSSPRAQSKTRRIRSTNGRAQSPCTGGQYPPSPMRNGATTPGTEEEKGAREVRGHGSLERKASKTDTPERKMAKSSSRDLNVDRSAESPVTPTGKPVAGTTDAEEASRLLAERRRQARLQKELEEKQRREQEEEERLRLEELRKRQAEERARQEEEERRAAEERQRQEQERRRCEEEEKRQRERRWLELQAQLEREREETEQQARREVERLRQERELIKLQEEQERLQRKKRIEEIMKRTRKTDTEVKKEAMRMEPPSPVSLLHPLPSPLARSSGVTQVNGQVGGQVHSTWLKTSTMPLAPSPVGPLISLGNLEVRGGGVDEFPDEVQSMDVSPIAKEDLVSIPEFSPVNEVTPISTSNARALEDLMDLTGQVGYPKTSPAVPLGDCNKNLIEGFSSSTETQLIQSLSSASEKLNIQ